MELSRFAVAASSWIGRRVFRMMPALENRLQINIMPSAERMMTAPHRRKAPKPVISMVTE